MSNNSGIPIIFAEDFSLEQKSKIRSSQKFRNFLSNLLDEANITSITIDKVYWFGEKPGYIIARTSGKTHDGHEFNNMITMVRGDAVGILVILKTHDGQEYTILTKQFRAGAGQQYFEEIPAGMLDEGNFKNKVIEELAEEVGSDLKINIQDLHYLDVFYPSVGGCDEKIQIFYTEKTVTQEFLNSLQNRITGLASENERIQLEVIPFDDLSFRAKQDAKTRMAYYGYCAVKNRIAEFKQESSAPALK